ncbi:hypothetical protein KR215_001994 [Drosophila sulfurigaster]|nr:hypothetical protein KR215_001994 [Drosophila sulfurigaster]
MKLLLSIEKLCRQLPMILFLLFALALMPAKASPDEAKQSVASVSVAHSSYCQRFDEEIKVSRPLCEQDTIIPLMVKRCYFSCTSANRLSVMRCKAQLAGSIIYPRCDDIFCQATGSDSKRNIDDEE